MPHFTNVIAALAYGLRLKKIPVLDLDGMLAVRSSSTGRYEIWSRWPIGDGYYYFISDVDEIVVNRIETRWDFFKLFHRVQADLQPWWFVEAMGQAPYGNLP